jgi:hypothetical protein
MDLGSSPPSKALQVNFIEMNIHLKFKDKPWERRKSLPFVLV